MHKQDEYKRRLPAERRVGELCTEYRIAVIVTGAEVLSWQEQIPEIITAVRMEIPMHMVKQWEILVLTIHQRQALNGVRNE